MNPSQLRRLTVGVIFLAVIAIVLASARRAYFPNPPRPSTGAAPARGEREANQEYVVPTNPDANPDAVRPGPMSSVAPPSERPPGLPAAPGDIAVYRSVVLDGAAQGNSGWIVSEPSVGANGRTQFYSGNKYASMSADYGQTWTHVNPFTFFPLPAGLTQFCCDQVVYYERTRALTFWFLQYHQSNPVVSGHNALRLAVANGQPDVANLTWFTYTITPQDLGYTDADSWFDYNDMAVSDNYLYITTNVNASSGQHGIIFRLSLDTLASHGALGSPWPHHTATNLGFTRPVQGATSTMYFGAHLNNSTIRILKWPEANSSPTTTDVSVDAWYNGDSNAPSPDGTNWVGYNLKPVQAAWVAKGLIGFMWNSAQGGGFPWPHVRWVRVNESGLGISDQGQIWNNSTAFAFPSVHTNDRGDIAGTIGIGGGGAAVPYPGVWAWISDSYSGGSLVLGGSNSIWVANGTNGDNRWGDYFTSRRHVPYGNTWVATGVSFQGGTGAGNIAANHVWFGREQDRPPVNNTIYVNPFSSTWEAGTAANPYKAVGTGGFATMPGDTVVIQAGNYNEAVRLNRAARLTAQGGVVKIGKP